MPTPKESWVDRQRETIRRSRIVTRLACFVEDIPDPVRPEEGIVKMSANQIRAGLGLLDKVLPGLQIVANTSTEGVVEMTEKEAVRELVRLSQEHPDVAQAIAEFQKIKVDKVEKETKSYPLVSQATKSDEDKSEDTAKQ